jgi:SAM-dependent methyltransferase
MHVIIQASSTNWEGGIDPSIVKLEGHPLLYHTINNFIPFACDITVVAPEYDKGNLDFILLEFPGKALKINYSDDASPLNRMIKSTKELDDSEYIIRVDGRNFCVDVDQIFKNLELARKNSYSCVRFPENFPPLFSGDIYNVGALRELYKNKKARENTSYEIHPKYFLSTTMVTPNLEKYTDEYLRSIRKIYGSVLQNERLSVDPKKSVKVADQISFHYDLVRKYKKFYGILLDVACGNGYGASLLSEIAEQVIGIDLDKEVIQEARNKFSKPNVSFLVSDVNALPYKDGYADCVTAFEIIEHIPPEPLLKEMHRVLKTNGTIYISTPQNLLGHIPLIGCHIHEFSLDNLKAEVSKFFVIEKVIGIKQGTIYFDNDEVGSNTFIVARKV